MSDHKRRFLVTYVGLDNEEHEEEVELSAEPTVIPGHRISRVHLVAEGTFGSNEGTITVGLPTNIGT